jgi:hypothetical protein
MGKLLLIVGVLAVAVIVVVLVLWGGKLLLDNRRETHKRGLSGAKKRIKALEADKSQHVKALERIREIATSSGADSENPLWSMVVDQVDAALVEEEKDV